MVSSNQMKGLASVLSTESSSIVIEEKAELPCKWADRSGGGNDSKFFSDCFYFQSEISQEVNRSLRNLDNICKSYPRVIKWTD